MRSPLNLARGPLMIDVAQSVLDPDERARLCHPLVGGVILFRRNFESLTQLRALTAEIRGLRHPSLLIAVDQEGGRVQRFISEFTRLPSLRTLGQIWQTDASRACHLAETVGYVLAVELRACAIDLSFTPVLDLDWGRSTVIKDRSFGREPACVSQLGLKLITGLKRGGMAHCGKHFPGHGWVVGDSHHTVPHDERSLDALTAEDLQPFTQLIGQGLTAIMPAHVIYPAVDSHPAGFSRIWLQDILRTRLQFDGVIFSDDLTMEGATVAGSITERAQAALSAGCDMALICNRPDLTQQLLTEWHTSVSHALAQRLERLQGVGEDSQWRGVIQSAAFATARAEVIELLQ